jgi:hypothetical protein
MLPKATGQATIATSKPPTRSSHPYPWLLAPLPLALSPFALFPLALPSLNLLPLSASRPLTEPPPSVLQLLRPPPSVPTLLSTLRATFVPDLESKEEEKYVGSDGRTHGGV